MRSSMIFALLCCCSPALDDASSGPSPGGTIARGTEGEGASTREDGTPTQRANATGSCPSVDSTHATDVPVQVIAGSPPQLAGGTIVPGRYVLTAARDYIVIGNPPPDGPSHRSVLDVTPTQMTSAPDTLRGTVLTMTYSTQGNEIESVVACITVPPDGVYFELGARGGGYYEATPTTLTIASARLQTAPRLPDGGSGDLTSEAVAVWTFTRFESSTATP